MQDLTETARRFSEILELSPQEREAFLLAFDDAEIREQVRSLVNADRRATRSGFLGLAHQRSTGTGPIRNR